MKTPAEVVDFGFVTLRQQVLTPLTTIAAHMAEIRDQLDAGADILDDLLKVEEGCERLSKLVNALGDGSVSGAAEAGGMSKIRHDLKNPLNSILGYTEIILEEYEDELTPQAVENLEHSKSLGLELVEIIDRTFADNASPQAEARIVNESDAVEALLASMEAVDTKLEIADEIRDCEILIVDDNPSNQEILHRRLRRHGFACHLAANGLEALDVLGEQNISLVLLDLIMPDMNGFEVLKEIRSGPQSDLPVIMVSGLNDPRGIAKCLANGANDYLSKPVEPIILDAKVISALERFTYRRELNKIAMTDQLTQVRNRRSLMQAMKRLVQQYEQEEREFAVVLLDIDHFKKVNDTYGHAAGDFVLQQFTQCLKSVTRADDIIGRMGGEEFLLAFQDTSVTDLKNICERLRRAVEDMRLDFEEHTIKITTSGGVYMSVEGMLPVEKMIDLADRRLYSAKTGGRNRIEHRSIGE